MSPREGGTEQTKVKPDSSPGPKLCLAQKKVTMGLTGPRNLNRRDHDC